MPILGWKIKTLGMIVVLSMGFFAGWKVCSWHESANNEKAIQKIIAEHAKDEQKNRDIIKELQNRKQKVITKEVVRYAKIKDVTDNRVCFANWDAVWLWNDALSGQEPVPENTPRTPTTPDGPRVTDTQVLENLNTNAARWEQLREQMNQIIEWDKKTFGASE